jgi:hypothetical protein
LFVCFTPTIVSPCDVSLNIHTPWIEMFLMTNSCWKPAKHLNYFSHPSVKIAQNISGNYKRIWNLTKISDAFPWVLHSRWNPRPCLPISSSTENGLRRWVRPWTLVILLYFPSSGTIGGTTNLVYHVDSYSRVFVDFIFWFCIDYYWGPAGMACVAEEIINMNVISLNRSNSV